MIQRPLIVGMRIHREGPVHFEQTARKSWCFRAVWDEANEYWVARPNHKTVGGGRAKGVLCFCWYQIPRDWFCFMVDHLATKGRAIFVRPYTEEKAREQVPM